MIDDLARRLAQPMPRRRAIRLLAGALAATAVPALRPAAGAAAVVSCGALGCSGKCCSATDWRPPGLQGVCCEETDVCCSGGHRDSDPDHTYGWCCPQGQTCGQDLGDCVAACKSPNFECGQDCCGRDQSCCPVHGDDGDPICCPEGIDCTKQIVAPNVAITADSPYVCCPAERLVTALRTTMCCPPGSVTQPGGGLSTSGGFCCTSSKVCGQNDCCDSLPSFPKRCFEGRCEYEFLLVDPDRIRALRNGSVKVPLQAKAPASVQVSVALPPSATARSAGGPAALAAAAKPKVLGRARLRIRTAGRPTVRVRLGREGRRLLRRRKQLRVVVLLTVSENGAQTSTATPVTLRAR